MGILVFDVGTSSMRGVLMNEQADILCQFQEKYHPDFHLSIYVTLNPEIWRSVLYDIAKNIQIWCEEHGHKVEMTSRKIVTNINSIHSSGRLEENTHIQQTKTKFTIITEEDSKIILAYPEDGEWEVRTLAEHPLQFEVLKEGLLKNHGYCKAEVDGVLRSYVAANEGVFECTPPESAEGTWEIKQVLDEASSDMAFADFDNDGELEMLTISPFHGEKISIFKKTDAEKLTFTADLLDSDVGPANVLHYTNNGEDYILSANREIDEIALYKVEK